MSLATWNILLLASGCVFGHLVARTGSVQVLIAGYAMALIGIQAGKAYVLHLAAVMP